MAEKIYGTHHIGITVPNIDDGIAFFEKVFGAIILFKSLTLESEGGGLVGAFAWRPLIVIVVAITVFGVMLEPLGLALSVPVLIAISSVAGVEFHWKGVAANAVVLTLVSWAIFVWALKLTIPVWPWFAR